jgi:hypothetical protein
MLGKAHPGVTVENAIASIPAVIDKALRGFEGYALLVG